MNINVQIKIRKRETMNRRSLALLQLSTLTAIHFIVDMLTGTLPGFLPVLMDRYSLTVGLGSLLITACAFSSNTAQIWAGTLRKKANRPRLIQVGMLLAATIVFTGVVPPGAAALWLLLLLALLVGVGVALVHPEGLRGICAIDATSIDPAVATSIFMLSGFLGYACGPLFGGILVGNFGFSGLFLLLIPVALLLWLFSKAHIRLAQDKPGKKTTGMREAKFKPTFWEIFWLSTFINTGCVIVQGLLPTYLNKAGFSLTFGGLSAMLFGLGAGTGALFTSSVLLKHFPAVNCIRIQLIAGIPLMTCYLLAADRFAWAAPLILLAGMLVGAGFPQLVVLARTAPNGPSLGTRMGLIVGGTWGIAGALFLIVGILADRIGLHLALLASPLSYLVTVILFILLPRRSSRQIIVQKSGNLA